MGIYDGTKKVDLDCGPNTITIKRREDLKKNRGEFSIPFGMSGADLIVKNSYYKDEENGLLYRLSNEKPPFDSQHRIAVLGNTTTCNLMNYIFPSSTSVSTVKCFNDRNEILQSLENKDSKFVAYASDNILLKGFLKSQGLENDYQFYSLLENDKDIPLSFEEYGVVIYDYNDKNRILYKVVNEWIKTHPLNNYDPETDSFRQLHTFTLSHQ